MMIPWGVPVCGSGGVLGLFGNRMKLLVTIDYWDGTTGKTHNLDAEDIQGGKISMQFINPAVASITITRAPNLLKVLGEKP